MANTTPTFQHVKDAKTCATNNLDARRVLGYERDERADSKGEKLASSTERSLLYLVNHFFDFLLFSRT